MKLQNLSVIFIIIVIPLILVVSYYISLQVDTLNMQAAYNTKLLESTKEAIDAFEINTVEWNSEFSQTADSKRRDVTASINTFISSFANNIGVGGTSKEYISAYIPAIAYTLYDGYYIYAPTDTKQTIKNEKGLGVTFSEDNSLITGYSGDANKDKGKILYLKKDGAASDGTYNGQEFTLNPENAQEDYKHILRPFKAYSEELGNDIIINYTLDNYITIYCNIDGKYSIKSGYLTDPDKIGGITDGSITNITFEGQAIQREKLSERIAYYEGETLQTKTFNYIYEAENNTKIYYGSDKKFFRLNKELERIYLDTLKSPVYKKYSIPKKTGSNVEYIELYQNLSDKKIYTKDSEQKYIEATNTYGINETCMYWDYSAINYCVESYVFTSWINNLDGLPDELYIDSENDPEDRDSLFSEHKKEAIKETVEGSLNQAITSYSRNSSGEYQLPQLSETDWDQILTNVSITTFVQGIPIGLKYYDNYAIATSTLNKEYVDPDEIYLNASGDNYYHMPYCTHLGEADLIGYRSIDYVRKSYSDDEDEEMKYYYFKHKDGSTIDVDQACYYCLVEKSQYGRNKETTDSKEEAYYTALLRERYMARKISDVKGQEYEEEEEQEEVQLIFNSNLPSGVEPSKLIDMPTNETPNKGAVISLEDYQPYFPYSEYPNVEFWGWSKNPNAEEGTLDEFTIQEDTTLYAIWKTYECQVTFMEDSKDSGNRRVLEYKLVEFNSKVEPPQPLDKNNYMFICWETESGEVFDFNNTIQEDITLYPYYVRNYNFNILIYENKYGRLGLLQKYNQKYTESTDSNIYTNTEHNVVARVNIPSGNTEPDNVEYIITSVDYNTNQLKGDFKNGERAEGWYKVMVTPEVRGIRIESMTKEQIVVIDRTLPKISHIMLYNNRSSLGYVKNINARIIDNENGSGIDESFPNRYGNLFEIWFQTNPDVNAYVKYDDVNWQMLFKEREYNGVSFNFAIPPGTATDATTGKIYAKDKAGNLTQQSYQFNVDELRKREEHGIINSY